MVSVMNKIFFLVYRLLLIVLTVLSKCLQRSFSVFFVVVFFCLLVLSMVASLDVVYLPFGKINIVVVEWSVLVLQQWWWASDLFSVVVVGQ